MQEASEKQVNIPKLIKYNRILEPSGIRENFNNHNASNSAFP